MIVYSYQCVVNGKRYIGITSHPNKRQRTHISNIFNQTFDLPFYRAVKYHGWYNFRYEVLAECDSVDEMRALEAHYIKLYDTFHNGYNATDGGEAAEQRRAKRRTLSQAMQEVHRNISDWLITRNGITIEVTNLKRWCRENGYDASCCQRIAKAGKGRHRDITRVIKKRKDTRSACVPLQGVCNASMEYPVAESDVEVLLSLLDYYEGQLDANKLMFKTHKQRDFK